MDKRNPASQAVSVAGRPVAVTMIILAFFLAAGFGTVAFDARPASAQPVLEPDGICEPASVRPNEPVLITCTVTLTNSGDEPATNLMATIGPADGCDTPIPTFIDLARDGELVPMGPLQLTYEVGDLAPGETLESVLRLVVVNYGTGSAGGSINVVSRDDPGVTARGETCWDVNEDAEAPATDLDVSKTLLTEVVLPAPEPFPEPPARPEDGEPVSIEVPPVQTVSEQAEYEIVVSNVGGMDMTDVSILDVLIGGTVLVDSEPPASGTDPLGRPTWELDGLASGEELRILATLGAPPDGNCTFTDDILIVSATPAGGEREDYVAFADSSVPVGPCGPYGGDACWHYPPDGEPTMAPCETEVCWAQSPDADEYRAVFDCEEDVEYCWSLPPGEGYAALRPCAEEACWFAYGSEDFEPYYSEVPCAIEFCEFTAPDGSDTVRQECDYPVCWSGEPEGGEWQMVWDCGGGEDQCWFSPPGDQEPALLPCAEETCWMTFGEGDLLVSVPCDIEFCEFTAPDGSDSIRGGCDDPICWSAPPEGGLWTTVYGCGEREELCWFSPPGDAGQPQLGSCEYPTRFAVNPPEGALDIGFGSQTVYFDEDACWPVPEDYAPFFTYPVPCDEVESIAWFIPADGGPAFPGYEDMESCWRPPLPELELPPDVELPPDLVVPGRCEVGDEPKSGEPGSSVPAEVVEAVSSPVEIVEGSVAPFQPMPSADVAPAEIVEGIVEALQPLPSADVIPAELISSERVEPAPDDGRDGTLPALPVPEEPPILPELVDLPQDESAPGAAALPDSGTGVGDGGGTAWGFAIGLATAGMVLVSVAVGVQRRRSL